MAGLRRRAIMKSIEYDDLAMMELFGSERGYVCVCVCKLILEIEGRTRVMR